MNFNFNFKESIHKIKQDKIKYSIDKEKSRVFTDFYYNANETGGDKNKAMPKQHIYKQIVPKIKLNNYIMPLKINPPIIQPDKKAEYAKTHLTKIVNVYQPEYNNHIKASGFGDFIRGTYFIIQFCEKYQLEYDVQMNHPFRKYLKKYSDKPELESDLESDLQIKFFDKTNFHPDNPITTNNKNEIIDDFFTYLKEQTFEDKIANVYAISFPFDPIIDEQKNYIRTILEPTDEFNTYIQIALQNMSFTFKQYIVIHIRSGDNMLIYNNEVNDEYLKSILGEIYKIYRPQYNYLLLSDSVKLKRKIINAFPNMRASFNEITHSGEGVEIVEENIKNTLLDFYLMAYSGRIQSYSCYDHGTGFSRWCAETFNVPYACVTVKTHFF